jgi:hypothetical protein
MVLGTMLGRAAISARNRSASLKIGWVSHASVARMGANLGQRGDRAARHMVGRRREGALNCRRRVAGAVLGRHGAVEDLAQRAEELVGGADLALRLDGAAEREAFLGRHGVLGATWDEIEGLDGNNPVWRVSAERMKMRREFVSPLCGAALDILRAVKPLAVGRYIFPDWHHANQDEPLADGAFNHLLERAGWLERHSSHGFRSSFSTLMNERPFQQPGDDSAIEAHLAHAKRDGVAGIYNQSSYIARRTELCTEWARMILAGAPDAITLLFGAAPAAAAA